MACLGLRTGTISTHDHRFNTRFGSTGHPPNRVAPPRSLPLPAARMAAVQSLPVHVGGSTGGTHIGGGGGPEKFDRWMKESVEEIVKNLREAPLFVHVYGGGPDETMLKTERAVAEDWAHMKGKWVKGEEPLPEGIILVEEIKEEDKEGIFEKDEGQNGESTKAWGVLIQGKGDDGGAACYLLKTSKAGGSNLGLFCTHYCLVRVKSFRETVRSQLTNCWLV